MAEAGFPDQESAFMQVVLAPSKTPKDIVDLWHREIARMMALTDVKERLSAFGLETLATTPEESASWIKTEVAKWAVVIRDANIKKIE